MIKFQTMLKKIFGNTQQQQQNPVKKKDTITSQEEEGKKTTCYNENEISQRNDCKVVTQTENRKKKTKN